MSQQLTKYKYHGVFDNCRTVCVRIQGGLFNPNNTFQKIKFPNNEDNIYECWIEIASSQTIHSSNIGDITPAIVFIYSTLGYNTSDNIIGNHNIKYEECTSNNLLCAIGEGSILQPVANFFIATSNNQYKYVANQQPLIKIINPFGKIHEFKATLYNGAIVSTLGYVYLWLNIYY
jgi:hypothetical protein